MVMHRHEACVYDAHGSHRHENETRKSPVHPREGDTGKIADPAKEFGERGFFFPLAKLACVFQLPLVKKIQRFLKILPTYI